ncbi:MAG: hypothetical protein QXD89_02885 [Candidatus Aenigmatarchaeota archaeon]
MRGKIYISLVLDKNLFMKAVEKFLEEKGQILRNKELVKFDSELNGINSKSRRAFLFHYLLKKYINNEF